MLIKLPLTYPIVIKLFMNVHKELNRMPIFNKLIGIELTISSYTFNCLEYCRNCDINQLQSICNQQHARINDVLNDLAGFVTEKDMEPADLTEFLAGVNSMQPLNHENMVNTLIDSHSKMIDIIEKSALTSSPNKDVASFISGLVQIHLEMKTALQHYL